jgi:hypothetical protein
VELYLQLLEKAQGNLAIFPSPSQAAVRLYVTLSVVSYGEIFIRNLCIRKKRSVDENERTGTRRGVAK